MHTAVLNSLNNNIMATFPHSLRPIFLNLGPTFTGVILLGGTQHLIHSILRCPNTLYTYNVKVGCILQS